MLSLPNATRFGSFPPLPHGTGWGERRGLHSGRLSRESFSVILGEHSLPGVVQLLLSFWYRSGCQEHTRPLCSVSLHIKLMELAKECRQFENHLS